VSNTSQEQLYTITLNESETLTSQGFETFTLSSDTWANLTPTSIPALTSADIITLTGTPYGVGSISIGNLETINTGSFTGNWIIEEFDGRFPDYGRVMDMCKQYPGLDIAYKKFKEVYKMVKEDYDGKERERKSRK
jgi:hypothetical protein